MLRSCFQWSNPVVQHCVCCILVSLCSANPCKKCGLGRKEHLGWLHNPLLTSLYTSTHNLLHPPIEFYPELLVGTKVTSAQLFTQPSSPASWSLPWAPPPYTSRVHRCPWVTMPLEFYQLLLTKMLSQSRPAKAEISMGPLPWRCFALNFTQCDWNWLHPTHPPQAEKDADSWKTSQNCNCD